MNKLKPYLVTAAVVIVTMTGAQMAAGKNLPLISAVARMATGRGTAAPTGK